LSGARLSLWRALHRREYRLYFFGQLVSMSGTWMQQTAQGWLVYRLTGSAVLLGLTAASSQAPALVLGLAGGVAADRWDRRKVLLWTQALALLQAAALAVLTSMGRVQVWHVVTLAACLGVVNAFDMPARQAFVTELVPPEEMGNAIALSGILINASRMVGPALAGILIARSGEASCFWLNASSYLAVLASLWAIRPRRPAMQTDESAATDVREGLGYVLRDPERRGLLLLLAAVSLAGMPLFSLMPAFSEGVLKAGPRGMGLLTAAVGFGAMGASLLLARLRGPEGLVQTVGRGAVGFGLALAAFGFSDRMGLAVPAAMAAGFAMMTTFAGGNIRLQSRSDDAHRGRLMSLFSMSFTTTAPFGALAAGWAAERFGAPFALTVGGAGCALAGFAFLGRNARRARAAAILAVLAASSLAAGTASAAPRALTWEECAAEAARANPSLASSRLALDASRATFYGSWNGLLPQLSLSNSVSESNASRQASWGASASASISLFDMGRVASIRSASASLSASQASLRRSSSDLRASLRQAFSSLMFSQASLEVARGILELRRHDSELVTLRYDSGRESKGNMLRAKAQTLHAEASLASAERDLRSSRREMSRQLGRESFEEFLASGAFAAPVPPARPEDFRTLLPLRPDVALSEASVRSAQASRAQASSNLWPSLSASYSRSRSDSVEFPSARAGWSAGATLSYPLFGGGPTSTYFSTLASRRGYEKAVSDLSATRLQALSDLESSWSSFADAADNVRVQDALLEAARQRNGEADVRYASGLLNFDNWEVIVSDRVSAERQTLSARRAAMDAETAWDRALGRALGE